MAASPDRLVADLEALLHRALSRSRTGAWTAADAALERATTLLPDALAALGPDDDRIRRCANMLGDLRTRVIAASAATRDELSQLRQAQARLQPARRAYANPPGAIASQFGSTA